MVCEVVSDGFLANKIAWLYFRTDFGLRNQMPSPPAEFLSPMNSPRILEWLESSGVLGVFRHLFLRYGEFYLPGTEGDEDAWEKAVSKARSKGEDLIMKKEELVNISIHFNLVSANLTNVTVSDVEDASPENISFSGLFSTLFAIARTYFLSGVENGEYAEYTEEEIILECFSSMLHTMDPKSLVFFCQSKILQASVLSPKIDNNDSEEQKMLNRNPFEDSDEGDDTDDFTATTTLNTFEQSRGLQLRHLSMTRTMSATTAKTTVDNLTWIHALPFGDRIREIYGLLVGLEELLPQPISSRGATHDGFVTSLKLSKAGKYSSTGSIEESKGFSKKLLLVFLQHSGILASSNYLTLPRLVTLVKGAEVFQRDIDSRRKEEVSEKMKGSASVIDDVDFMYKPKFYHPSPWWRFTLTLTLTLNPQTLPCSKKIQTNDRALLTSRQKRGRMVLARLRAGASASARLAKV